ncbi:MAG: MFS transporter [Actinomycetales bacterium]
MTATRATTAAASEPAGSLLARPYRSLVIGLLAIITCAAFESMAVTTAMPVVARELHGESAYGLAFSLLLTAALAATASAGAWCDRRGPRPSLLTGLALMCGGLLASGFAADFLTFTLGRMVSGLGSGFMIVPVYVIIGQVLPGPLQPALFSWFSAAWVVPSLVGPFVAGLLAQHASWRWVFYGVAPIVLVAVVLVWPHVRHLGAPAEKSLAAGDGRRRALLGLLLSGGVFAAQWAGYELANPAGTLRSAAPVLLWLAVAAGLAAVVIAAPRLLPAKAFRLARGLPSVVVCRGLLALAFFGAEAFVPLMLTSTRSLSPSMAGLALSGSAIGWTAGSFLQARIHFRRSILLVVGPAVLALALGTMALSVVAGGPAWLLAAIWVLAGAAMGTAITTTSVLLLEYSPAPERGRNSASLQLADMLGGVIGTAGAGMLYSLMRNPSNLSDPTVFAVLWGALALAAAVGIASGARSRRPRSEVQPL